MGRQDALPGAPLRPDARRVPRRDVTRRFLLAAWPVKLGALSSWGAANAEHSAHPASSGFATARRACRYSDSLPWEPVPHPVGSFLPVALPSRLIAVRWEQRVVALSQPIAALLGQWVAALLGQWVAALLRLIAALLGRWVAVRRARNWLAQSRGAGERQLPGSSRLPCRLRLRSLETERVGQQPFSLLLPCSLTWFVCLAPPFSPPREGEPGRLLPAHWHLGIQMVYS